MPSRANKFIGGHKMTYYDFLEAKMHKMSVEELMEHHLNLIILMGKAMEEGLMAEAHKADLMLFRVEKLMRGE